MFSGFDTFAEGFKRFSLDALQDQDDGENGTKEKEPPLPLVPEHPESPTKNMRPVPAKEENDEWDWDQGNSAAGVERKVAGIPQRPPRATNTLAVDMSPAASPAAALETSALDDKPSQAGGALDEQINLQREIVGGALGGWEDPERKMPSIKMAKEGHMLFGENSGGTSPGVAADNGSGPLSLGEEVLSDNMEVPSAPVQGDICGKLMADEAGEIHAWNTRTSDPSKSAGIAKSVGSEMDGGAATISSNGSSAVGPAGADEGGAPYEPRHSGERPDGHEQTKNQRVQAPSSAQKSLEAAMTGARGAVLVVESEKDTFVEPPALLKMRQELSLVKKAASGLEGALRESRSEVRQLREMLATEKDTTRKLSDEVNATRLGFQESNAAHQRTAERSHALEEELRNTYKVVDVLRAESAALKAKVDEAAEDRQTLEGKLRHLQAGLTEGQEAARQEGRQEVERLEARLKELLKDRDRKQAELELQNARRKETREMARDLESQLAAVERIAQEREVELSMLKDEMLALRRNTGEATDEKNTWATKYEALERNFKQVRAQSKRTESELEEARQNAVRIEAEKAVLEERVEVEGAERVTVVASVSHERDFLLRQVDRLEQELTELRRVQEAQATAAAARAQTTGVLEEYRTRAQQALKRANEITSQTAAENKRLEAEISKLYAEVAQQRPLWKQSKQLEEVHRAEVAELREQVANKAADLSSMTMAMAALEARLAQEEEAKRNAHTSVMRLESQGKSLKQELQRQQKALVVAQENEATLQARLADQEAALQAVEKRERGKSSHEGAEANADVAKYQSSPKPGVSSRSMGWEEEKRTSRSGTPRSWTGTEVPGTAWADTRNLGESSSSVPSEGDSADAAQGTVGEQLFYVHQLRERMSKEQIEMRSLISELEASRTTADAQAAKQAQLEKQLEAALLDKKRLQDLDSGRNAAINLEYLKNCVVGALRTSEPSEHARLLPVITTILKLSEDEAEVIAKNITRRAQHEGSFGGSLPTVGDAQGSSGGSRSWWNINPQQK